MKDEQLMTESFEELVGGVSKARQLFNLYKNSHSHNPLYGEKRTKQQVFETKAKNEGFTNEQIQFFYELQ